MSPAIALIALLAELATGYPDAVFRVIGHPVSWIGQLIAALDRTLNRPDGSARRRRLAGCLALALLVVAAAGAGWAVQRVLPLLAAGMLAGTLVAQRSLGAHVAAVARALESEGIDAGRRAVSRIVGRDPEQLDGAGVARAAIESLAENFSDGVVAPVVWLAAAGLPGGAAYKAINTADSMIGNKSERYRAFGWAAARVDDIVNLPASRLATLLLVAAAALSPGASPAGRGARCGGTQASTGRRTPAGQKLRWQARSDWRWPARAATAACSSTTR